jgi:hypothetical protein
MALRSRRQREQEQKRRMARGKRNLSQLVGAQAQGQRTPMNRGSGSVNTVQAPKFQESNVANDITQAGLAYKGGKGLFDFTQGKEAYIDEAGNAIKAVEPWTIGGESIPDKISSYGTGLGNLGENLFNMQPGSDSSWFGTPTPNMSGSGGMGGMGGMGGGYNIAQLEAAKSGDVGNSLGTTMQFQTNSPPSGLGQLSTPTVPPGIDKLGLAGAGLGAGMSIYDMADQGITPGNAMGLIGSLGVGASAFPSLGLSALGPIGMGIGGLGAVGSLFDWW